MKKTIQYLSLFFSVLSLIAVFSYKANAVGPYGGNGGLFRTEGTYSPGGGCYAGNPYTGSCTCPVGYLPSIVTAHDSWAVFQCYK